MAVLLSSLLNGLEATWVHRGDVGAASASHWPAGLASRGRRVSDVPQLARRNNSEYLHVTNSDDRTARAKADVERCAHQQAQAVARRGGGGRIFGSRPRRVPLRQQPDRPRAADTAGVPRRLPDGVRPPTRIPQEPRKGCGRRGIFRQQRQWARALQGGGFPPGAHAGRRAILAVRRQPRRGRFGGDRSRARVGVRLPR